MWEVELLGTLEGGWSSYAAFGMRREEPVVLKVVPLVAEGRAEIAGLLARDGRGVPTLLRHDFAQVALLLSRMPGRAPAQGELDVGSAAELLRGLHVPVDSPPPHVPWLRERLQAHWASRVVVNRDRGCPLPDGLVADAASSVERLCASWSRPVLLHGDFERRNILCSEDGAVAIDSPAAVGDPGYDVAWWLLSECAANAELFRHDAILLADALAYPAARIWSWAWPLAVDDLLDKLFVPGWLQEDINDAFGVARMVAGVTARRWDSVLA
ncbi:MAG: aminoglycoside phosphotransferase family protein [Sciscionella sp.]